MTNVTRIKPAEARRSAHELCDLVIRTKQIVRAVRTASQHDDGCDYQYAFDQVEDMLEEATQALSIMEDDESRRTRASGGEPEDAS